MKTYSQMSKDELLALKSDLEKSYKAFKDQGLKLDMSRGKPAAEQRDCGSACSSQPVLWQIRLYSVYLLGKKCAFCSRI